jgi:hypothetical protein
MEDFERESAAKGERCWRLKEFRKYTAKNTKNAKNATEQFGALFCLPLCCLLYSGRKVLVGIVLRAARSPTRDFRY